MYRYYKLCEPTLCIVTYNFNYQFINNSPHTVFLFFQTGHIQRAATQNIRYAVELILSSVYHLTVLFISFQYTRQCDITHSPAWTVAANILNEMLQTNKSG